MRELVSPQQSDTLILFASALLTVGLAVYGATKLGRRGLVAGLVGPLVFGAWQAHKFVTRYDPRTGYFGLNKVAVLLGEAVAFVLVGAVLGYVWRMAATKRDG